MSRHRIHPEAGWSDPKRWQAAAGEWVCEVWQSACLHRARKLTWLYAVRTELPELEWSVPAALARLESGLHTKKERRFWGMYVAPRVNETRLHGSEHFATPPAFAKLLVQMARSVS